MGAGQVGGQAVQERRDVHRAHAAGGEADGEGQDDQQQGGHEDHRQEDGLGPTDRGQVPHDDGPDGAPGDAARRAGRPTAVAVTVRPPPGPRWRSRRPRGSAAGGRRRRAPTPRSPRAAARPGTTSRSSTTTRRPGSEGRASMTPGRARTASTRPASAGPPRSTSTSEAGPQVGGDLVGATEDHEATAVQDRHAVGQAAGLAQEVGAEHDGAALLGGESGDEADHLAGGGWDRGRRWARRGRGSRGRAAGTGPGPPACAGRWRSRATRRSARSVMANCSSTSAARCSASSRAMPRMRAVNTRFSRAVRRSSRPAFSVSTPVRRRTASPSIAGSRPSTVARARVGGAGPR